MGRGFEQSTAVLERSSQYAAEVGIECQEEWWVVSKDEERKEYFLKSNLAEVKKM